MPLPAAHVVGPGDGHRHTHTVIFLHGRDSRCTEFADELFESETSGAEQDHGPQTLTALFPTVRWVFPAAPLLRSERFGATMSQWFDMWSVESSETGADAAQGAQLAQSAGSVLELVREEEKLVPRSRLFLAGISQGFATALAAFLAAGEGFAGLIGLCAWMPRTDALERRVAADGQGKGEGALFVERQAVYDAQEAGPAAERVRTTPVFLCHASDDEVVPVASGRRLRNVLADRLGLEMEWHEYPSGGHWINEPEGVEDLARFLREKMAAGGGLSRLSALHLLPRRGDSSDSTRV